MLGDVGRDVLNSSANKATRATYKKRRREAVPVGGPAQGVRVETGPGTYAGSQLPSPDWSTLHGLLGFAPEISLAQI